VITKVMRLGMLATVNQVLKEIYSTKPVIHL